MKVAIAGASGLVGSALIPVLKSMGAQITRMVRSKPRAGELEWHPNDVGLD
jgi:NAD dependent epimerase/dehydratase family enzyme